VRDTAVKIAWREARASSTRFLFVVVAVALGVGALTGVRGFSEAFRGMLTRDARKLMAADMTVRIFNDLPTPSQSAAMDSIGADRTWITEAISMLSSSVASTPVLVSVKAVDPRKYPFYGEMKLDPPLSLLDALKPDAIAVSDDLFVRLDVKHGDTVKLGDAEFRIVATVVAEPDRMAGSLNVGPRILMSREGLDRSGLVAAPGSRSSHRYLFRFTPTSMPVEKGRQTLVKTFPEGMVIDYRETHPLITRGLDRATKFLSLVSLIALIVGALGVGMAMHSHLQQKMDSIAVMKSLGARSSQVIRIYTLQTLMLGTLGGIAGILVGLAVQRIFPELIARYFQLDPGVHLDWGSAFQGLAVGVLTTLLFTLPPLLNIRRIRPSLILRREMQEARVAWKQRIRNGKAAIGVAGIILVGVLGIVWWLSDSWQVAVYFTGGFVASLLILSAIAGALLGLLRRLLRTGQQGMPVALRHGLANVYRPGNQASALLVALGLGVMFTLTVYLVQKSMLVQIANSAPPGMPNVFLINITPRDSAAIAAVLNQQQGLSSKAEVTPIVSARISHINGTPIEQRRVKARPFLRTRSVSWAAEPPPQTVVLEGSFWRKEAAPGQVCLGENAARNLEVKPGDKLDWVSGTRTVHSQVVCVYRSEAVRVGSNVEFLFNPGTLDGLPALYFAAIRIAPNQVAPLQRAVFRQFPTVTVINGADVLAIVQEVVDQIALVIRFISFFAILAGAIILSSSVAGTRFRRIREVVILKTLGATRGRIAGIFSVEFLLLGAFAGVLGSLLATAFSFLVLNRLFEVDYKFDPIPHLIAITMTALLANLAGWLASHRILQQKPLEALRGTL